MLKKLGVRGVQGLLRTEERGSFPIRSCGSFSISLFGRQLVISCSAAIRIRSCGGPRGFFVTVSDVCPFSKMDWICRLPDMDRIVRQGGCGPVWGVAGT